VQQLSSTRIISDIEFIINRPRPGLGQRKWAAKGAECSIDRHSFTGDVYSFHVEILQIRLPATGRPSWKLVIVSEFWHGSDGERIHSAKWLKLLLGKPTEVLKWIRTNRDAAAASEESRS
jgi:hypothetical protein